MLAVIAFDPGIEHTGYAVLTATAQRVGKRTECCIECLDIGTIKTLPSSAIEKRCLDIFTHVRALLWEQPCLFVAVEDYFFGVNRKSGALVLQAKGALLAACGAAGVGVRTLNPTVVKKHLTKKGNASKAAIRAVVQKRFPLTTAQNEHEYDAVAIGICAIETATGRDRERLMKEGLDGQDGSVEVEDGSERVGVHRGGRGAVLGAGQPRRRTHL